MERFQFKDASTDVIRLLPSLEALQKAQQFCLQQDVVRRGRDLFLQVTQRLLGLPVRLEPLHILFPDAWRILGRELQTFAKGLPGTFMVTGAATGF